MVGSVRIMLIIGKIIFSAHNLLLDKYARTAEIENDNKKAITLRSNVKERAV